jgi:hypothetical protein
VFRPLCAIDRDGGRIDKVAIAAKLNLAVRKLDDDMLCVDLVGSDDFALGCESDNFSTAIQSADFCVPGGPNGARYEAESDHGQDCTEDHGTHGLFSAVRFRPIRATVACSFGRYTLPSVRIVGKGADKAGVSR